MGSASYQTRKSRCLTRAWMVLEGGAAPRRKCTHLRPPKNRRYHRYRYHHTHLRRRSRVPDTGPRSRPCPAGLDTHNHTRPSLPSPFSFPVLSMYLPFCLFGNDVHAPHNQTARGGGRQEGAARFIVPTTPLSCSSIQPASHPGERVFPETVLTASFVDAVDAVGSVDSPRHALFSRLG